MAKSLGIVTMGSRGAFVLEVLSKRERERERGEQRE